MKLTKEDLDKVRNIEGFPIGSDEDIIALSRPPYYTACPNPFIKEFIEKNGTSYDEEADDYHCEPFAADVSEGKKDPVYNAHSYHTKVPYKAIMRYILHYTKPGDIIFDGFCGTGMTGVAAQMCGTNNMKIQNEMLGMFDEKQWGARKAILSDLSPAATYISSMYNYKVDVDEFQKIFQKIIKTLENECSWMYETKENNEIYHVNYIVWSDVFICPQCGHEIIFWDVAVDKKTGSVKKSFKCSHCNAMMTKKDCDRAIETVYDDQLDSMVKMSKQVMVLVSYQDSRGEHIKSPSDYDLCVNKKIDNVKLKYWMPIDRMCEGKEARRNDLIGVTHVHQFYKRRNAYILSAAWDAIQKENCDQNMKIALMGIVTGVMQGASRLQRFRLNSTFPNMILSGTLYIGSMVREWNVLDWMRGKFKSILRLKNAINSFKKSDVIISTNSLTDENIIQNDSVDYIFTDPPFGDNLMYSELSYMWESWLKVKTNNRPEAIINTAQKKGVTEYQELMMQCFYQYYRILKPNRWITVEFHNSKNAVWNAIQEGLLRVGFIVADIRTLDKKQGSFKQVQNSSAVKQDLIISAYKPSRKFVNEFNNNAGDVDIVWQFVRQHLEKIPVCLDVNHNKKIDIISERCDYLLFDRMVAYHIVHGIPVPMDAHTFYDGLRQRFVERDGMFFNPDQVNEYDEKRLTMEVEDQQMALFVTDEKNAIAWLHQLLDKTHLSYQEIQPKYLQELHQDKREEIPELLDMLKENFVQDAAGKWYIPDLTDAADLAKLRRKKLLKEFYDSYAAGKQKIKVARQEAIRAGFDDCWAKKDYATIVHVGDRLPEAVLQEDQALLMYYDNASSRV